MSVTRRHQDNRAHRATVLVMTLGLLFWQVGGAQAAPRVEISVADAQVNEGNTITYRVEMTEPPATPDVIPVSVQIWSTAAGANPVRVEMGDMGHHRLWFTEGVERHTLTVRTRRQAATNATSTVKARVESSNRFSITGDATVTAQAVDHASPALSVAAESRSVRTNEGEAAQIVVELDDAAQSDIDVNVKTEVVTGASSHYPEIQEGHIGMRTVRIHRGTRQAFVPLFVRDDNVVNHEKSVSLTVLAGTGYTVGTNNTAQIAIQGDTVADANHTLPAGADTAVLRWEGCGEDALVNEADGSFSLTALVEGTVEPSWSFKAIRSQSEGFSATLNNDIVANAVAENRTVKSRGREKSFLVNLVNDVGVENEETFGFELSVNGPMSKSIFVDERCAVKVARIADNDRANITAGPRVRRVVEGERINFNLKVDDHTSSNCPIPFDIKIRGQVSGDADAINTIVSGDRGETSVDLNSCTASAALGFSTTALAGQQGPRRIAVDLWTTNGNGTTRDRVHTKIRIDGEESSLSRYIVYIDDVNDTTPVSTPGTNVRLQGGNAYSEGRLEVFTNNRWGTVCDDYWTKRSADVACRSLGFADGSTGMSSRYTRAFFGAGAPNVPIHFDDVRCSGDETSLFECPRRPSGNNCRHREDVGVSCAGTALPPPSAATMPTVVTEAGSSSLALNEGDTATFWLDRHQPYDTPLDVDVMVSIRPDRDPDGGTPPSIPHFRIDEAELGARTLTIPAGETRGSITVTMHDDDLYAYNTYVDLGIEPSTSYDIGARSTATAVFRNGTYKVSSAGQRYFDDRADRIKIGWKDCGEDLVVPENIGRAEPIIETSGVGAAGFDYPIVLVNEQKSATRRNDYIDSDATGTRVIRAGDRETTVSMRIVDSNQIEEREYFEVSLLRSGLDDLIKFECLIKRIVITDDDTAEMTMGARERTVTEGNDINFEISVPEETGDCIIAFPIDVALTPAGDDVDALEGAEAVAGRESYLYALEGTGAVEAHFRPCDSYRDVIWKTIQTAGDQGTRTVHFDVNWVTNEEKDRRRVFFDGMLEAPVRYTVHIEDSEASTTTDTNTNDTRGVEPTPGKGPKGPPPPTPITASIQGLPGEHDGSSPFTFELLFSPAPKGLSYRTVRDSLFTVTNGQITKARRMVPKQSQAWEVSVQPSNDEELSIRLKPTADCNTAGAVCTAEGGALETALSRTVRGPVKVAVADAAVDEAQGAMLEFEVTLNRALDEMFTINYATVDGTARGGEDYSTRAGTLAFAPGSTRKTVSVPVLDDSHNEGAETLELRLSNPSPTRVKLGDASATGTIQNSDPMPTAWMIRLGRTVGSQVLEGVSDRVHGTGSPHMSIGGMQVGNNQGDEPQGGAPDTQWQDKGDPLGARTPEEILRQSSFHWSNADDEAQTGPTVNAWGRFATNTFEAEEGKVAMDGDVTTGLLGVDAQWARGLAGVMLSWTESSGAYRASNEHNAEQGKVRASLAGVYPYASMSLNERVFAWGLIGAGSGELTLEPQGARALPTDLSLRIGALGLTGQILDGSGPSGIGLNVKSDVLWVSTKNEKTDDLIATSGDVSRLRLRLQGERTFATKNGARFIPDIEVGLRQDAGDAETGTGIEIGAGVRYEAGTLSVEGRIQGLLTHEDAGYEEWGASGTIQWTQSQSGRGLSLSIVPRWGATKSRADRLWSARSTKTFGLETDSPRNGRLEMEAGYGFGLGQDRGVLTPYAAMTLGDEAGGTVRGGARWKLGQNVQMNIEATRQTTDNKHDTELRAEARVQF